MEPGIFDARSVKRETMSRGGEGNNGEASRRDTTQRDFFTGGEDLSGRIKPSLSFSFILSSRLFSKRLRFLLRRRVVSKVGKTFNGTNSARDERGGGSIFSSNVLLATLITRTALRCL